MTELGLAALALEAGHATLLFVLARQALALVKEIVAISYDSRCCRTDDLSQPIDHPAPLVQSDLSVDPH